MIQLREHQNTVVDILDKNSKGQIIVPTGGGKTMCMIEDFSAIWHGACEKLVPQASR